MKSCAILIMFSLTALTAQADDVAKPDCRPPVIPNPYASDIVVKSFEKHSRQYSECISKFVDAQRAIYTNPVDATQASLAHSAAEAAITEFNKYSEELKIRNERTTGGNDEEQK